jgi:hypothetical protein
MRSRLLLPVLALVLAVGPTTAATAQTPDGETPAVEDICTKWGMTGQVNGLCKAYCEAMDCDDPNPQASEQACGRVLDKITTALGDTPFPTCQDTDGDGVPNGVDNCPDVANADQADANPATPEGDACEPVVVTCPCLGTGDPAAPATTEALIASAEDFAAQYSASVLDEQCNSTYSIQYTDDPETSLSSWGVEVNPSVCAIGWTIRAPGSSETIINSFIDTLTPEQDAACQAVLDALKAADPFGICAN